MTPKYINPYTDFGFKKLFGQEANKEPLIDFLNSVLPEKHRVKTVTFRNSEGLPEAPIERRAIFDIFCVSESGERFIVEMQKAKEHYFRDRSVYYMTFPIREQAQVGGWNFQLDPVYFIAILDFVYDEAEERRKLMRNVSLKDQDGDEFYDKLRFIFFQMPLFNKTESELETQQDKWLFFLKNLQNFDRIPEILNEPVFERAFATAEFGTMSPDEQFRYMTQQITLWDNFAVMETATMEAAQVALQEGKKEGRKEGRKEGLREGRKEEKLEIAREMKRDGMSLDRIVKYTGLSKDEIKQLE